MANTECQKGVHLLDSQKFWSVPVQSVNTTSACSNILQNGLDTTDVIPCKFSVILESNLYCKIVCYLASQLRFGMPCTVSTSVRTYFCSVNTQISSAGLLYSIQDHVAT
jgi:hypothetical protein